MKPNKSNEPMKLKDMIPDLKMGQVLHIQNDHKDIIVRVYDIDPLVTQDISVIRGQGSVHVNKLRGWEHSKDHNCTVLDPKKHPEYFL